MEQVEAAMQTCADQILDDVDDMRKRWQKITASNEKHFIESKDNDYVDKYKHFSIFLLASFLFSVVTAGHTHNTSTTRLKSEPNV